MEMRPEPEHVGVGRAFHRVFDFQHQECRRHAEADGVAQAVELGAEFAGLLGPPRDAAIEHVEQHRQKDEYGRQKQVVLTGRVGTDFGRKGDRSKSAGRVPQREQRGEDGEHLGAFYEVAPAAGEAG